MALFDTVKNFFTSLIKPKGTTPDLSASIGSFAEKNIGFIPPQQSAPPISVIKGGISGFADIPKPGFDPFKPETFGRGGIAGPMDVFGGIRPIIPPAPIAPAPIAQLGPVAPPGSTDPTQNPSFSGSYQSPEQKAQMAAIVEDEGEEVEWEKENCW